MRRACMWRAHSPWRGCCQAGKSTISGHPVCRLTCVAMARPRFSSMAEMSSTRNNRIRSRAGSTAATASLRWRASRKPFGTRWRRLGRDGLVVGPLRARVPALRVAARAIALAGGRFLLSGEAGRPALVGVRAEDVAVVVPLRIPRAGAGVVIALGLDGSRTLGPRIGGRSEATVADVVAALFAGRRIPGGLRWLGHRLRLGGARLRRWRLG